MPRTSTFPPTTVDEAATIAKVIAERNAGQPMRRLDIFHALGRAPDSGPSRALVTSSSGYALTEGGYQAETLRLTELGRRYAIEQDGTALLDAVVSVDLFRRFFERYVNQAFPNETSAKAFLAEAGVPTERLDACLGIIRSSGKAAGIIQERSGADRILSAAAARETVSLDSEVKVVVPAEERDRGDPPAKETKHHETALNGFPAFNINLQINLPADASPDTYDAIFRGIREHLLDARLAS